MPPDLGFTRFKHVWKCALCAGLVLAAVRAVNANVTLDMSSDRIFLTDGTILNCTLICRGKETVIVLVGEEERTFPASSVLRLDRGQPTGERKSFETGPVGGHEQIVRAADRGDLPPPAQPLRAERDRKKGRRKETGAKPGMTPLGGKAERKKRRQGRQKRPAEKRDGTRREAAGIDAETVRNLIKNADGEDIIKAIEELKRKFGREDN